MVAAAPVVDVRALITGGSSGLGAALVSLLRDTSEVAVADLVPPEPSGGVTYFACDLIDVDATRGLGAQLSDGGPFDLVVMSAGISAVGAFETIPFEQHERVLALNYLSPLVLTRELMELGLLARGGRLIFVASLSHFVGYPGASVYAASKDGLVGFARSIRQPYRRGHGINVQVAAPGPMRTDHAARYAPPGSTEKGRADPLAVARTMLARRSGFMIVPGFAPALMAAFGRLAPTAASALTRKLIYERLT